LNYGHSRTVDLLGEIGGRANPESQIVLIGDLFETQKEGVVIGEIDIRRLRSYRQREVWGPNFRRPDLYAALSRPTDHTR
jgi:predicted amidohydrolase